MKRNFTLFLTLLFTLSNQAFSQNYYPGTYELPSPSGEFYMMIFNNHDYFNDAAKVSLRKKLGIKSIVSHHITKKGRDETLSMTFNSSGRMLTSKSKSLERKCEYLHDSLEIYSYTNYKGKIEEVKRQFEGKLVVNEERYRNSKLITKKVNTYNADKKLVNCTVDYKGTISEMKYYYNEQGKLTKTEQYKKGKLKRSWVHECKEQGELLASTKTEMTSSKCEFREESADGSYVIFTRTIVQGKTILNKKTFSKDSLLIKYEDFDKDSVLTYYWKTENNVRETMNFRKGKISFGWKTTYDDAGNLVKTQYFRKGKLTSTTKNEYDSNGNKILVEHYSGKKQKLFSTDMKEFNADGTLKSTKHVSKGKLSSPTTYEYSFF